MCSLTWLEWHQTSPNITRHHQTSPDIVLIPQNIKHECASCTIRFRSSAVEQTQTIRPKSPEFSAHYQFLLQLSFTAQSAQPPHFGHHPSPISKDFQGTRVCRRLSRICSGMPSGPPKISSSRCSRAPFDAREERDRCSSRRSRARVAAANLRCGGDRERLK